MRPFFLSIIAVPLLASALFAQSDPLRVWVGLKDAKGLDSWTQARLDAAKRDVGILLSAKGPRTVSNTLRPYDDAGNELTIASNEIGVMFATHADKGVRDEAQKLEQTISSAVTDLSLNQPVYRALSSVDVSKANAATQYFMKRTLLEYRLAGVDKDEAVRGKIRQLQDEQTRLSLEFSRHVQDDVHTVTVRDQAELAGLPDDYVKAHASATAGTLTITSNYPDVLPVLTYAKSAALRREVFFGVQQPGLSGQPGCAAGSS